MQRGDIVGNPRECGGRPDQAAETCLDSRWNRNLDRQYGIPSPQVRGSEHVLFPYQRMNFSNPEWVWRLR